jgi:hypothetical protein
MNETSFETIFNFTKTKMLPLAGNNYKIFITADKTPDVYMDIAKKYLDTKHIFHTNGKVHHLDWQGKRNDTCLDDEKSILDFHLLRDCDMALICQSGFGIYGVFTRPDPFKNLYVYTYKEREIFQVQHVNDTEYLRLHKQDVLRFY